MKNMAVRFVKKLPKEKIICKNIFWFILVKSHSTVNIVAKDLIGKIIAFTHHWKCQLAKKKELLIPPIWGCCGPTGGSIFTPGQKNHPAFFEGRWYTGKMARQIWAEWAVCLSSYLWKGWMVFLPRGKNWTSSRSTTTPDRWYWKFFFFGQLVLPMMCDVSGSFGILKILNYKYELNAKGLLIIESTVLHPVLILKSDCLISNQVYRSVCIYSKKVQKFSWIT